MKDIETTRIIATSSFTLNLGNFNSAKVEFTMEKVINNPDNVNLEEEKEKLWNEVNDEVDKQIRAIRQSI